MMERTNKELKTMSKMVRAFPNQESISRLTGPIPIYINENWITGNKYNSNGTVIKKEN